MTLLVTSLVALVFMVACSSPEVARTRGGGAGADVGNRGRTVQMHEGSGPYHDTPQLISRADTPAAEAGRKSNDQTTRR
jgi:hypothetical protein